jgi:threonine/homoserine/homoserine lactone efflux protein
MNSPWLSFILLAIAASFLPLQFGLEISLLGKDDGIKNGVSFASGVTLFRIVLVVGLGVIFTGLLVVVSDLFSNISADIKNVTQQFGLDITSGEHVLFDGLLILAGIALWIQVYHHIRNRSKADQSAKSDSSTKGQGKGAIGLLLLGFTWVALSANQWLFMTASIGQIFSLSGEPLARLLLFFLFLLIASLMLLLPILFYFVRPQSARKDLEKIDNWFNEAMPYVVVGILFVIGLYFIISGTTGVMNFLASQ